jgi:prophage antirepressor-like protein
MTQNELLKFEGHQVRMIIRDGVPWWVAKDVCDILGLRNSRDAVAQLDDDERDSVGISDAIGRNKKQTVVNESGVWSLILKSNKPEAKRLRKWFTSDVLPTISRTGEFRKELPAADHVGDPVLAILDACQTMRMEQISMDERLRKIEDHMEHAQQAIRALPAPAMVLSDLPLRAQCRQAVDNLCRLAGLGHQQAWVRAYKEYDLRFRTNLTARMKNAGRERLTIIEEDGNLDVFYAIIMGLIERLRRD